MEETIAMRATAILAEVKKTDREWQRYLDKWNCRAPQDPAGKQAHAQETAKMSQYLQNLLDTIVEWLRADQDLLDETVHDHKGAEAAAINNSSREEQIIYILTGR